MFSSICVRADRRSFFSFAKKVSGVSDGGRRRNGALYGCVTTENASMPLKVVGRMFGPDMIRPAECPM